MWIINLYVKTAVIDNMITKKLDKLHLAASTIPIKYKREQADLRQIRDELSALNFGDKDKMKT